MFASQNTPGSSKDELVKRAAEERDKRQSEKTKNVAAVKIQVLLVVCTHAHACTSMRISTIELAMQPIWPCAILTMEFSCSTHYSDGCAIPLAGLPH